MDTRQVIIDVAARLFAERGMDGVSVREITREARVNLGAITYHFGSKEALFADVILEKIQPLIEIGAEVSASSNTPSEKLKQILLRSSLHILNRDPSLKAFFAESLQGGKRLPKKGVEAIAERNRKVSAILHEGIQRGEFRACDVDCATWVFFGMVMPYVLHQPLMNPEHRRGPYEEKFVRGVVDEALNIFFNGIKA